MTNVKNFGNLDSTYQPSLIKVILEDKKFATRILDILDPHYFEGASFKYIVQIMKEYYAEYEEVPIYVNIEHQLKKSSQNDTSSKMHFDTLDLIKNIDVKNVEQVKDTALEFCRRQNLKKELKEIQVIIDQDDFESYPSIEEKIKRALQVGTDTSELRDAFDDVESVLSAEARQTIPTGVSGLDELLKGGLGRGELGILLAPTGIGKTTLMTLFANAAHQYGFNVLQVIFEDNINNILRKHYTVWSKVKPDDLSIDENKPYIIEKINQAKANSKGELKICKLPSDSVTVTELKSHVRKYIMEGFKPDIILIDYVDCIVPEKAVLGEEWKGEGTIMRRIEAMTDEFDAAIWVATQGNRESISAELVTADLTGGSIKKMWIGHVVISVGKTLEQKDNNLATMTLLKSRIGKDGVMFQNCTFNNEMMIVATENQLTLFGHEQALEDYKKERAVQVFKEKLKETEFQPVEIVPVHTNMSEEKINKIKDDINKTPIDLTEEDKVKRLRELHKVPLKTEYHETTILGYKNEKLTEKQLKNARREKEKQIKEAEKLAKQQKKALELVVTTE